AHAVHATVQRDVTAVGSIVIRVTGASGATTSASASAGGAPEQGSADEQGASASLGDARDYAAGKSANGATLPSAPTPSTPAGTVSVAAAIAVTLFTSSADATVDGVQLSAAAVTLEARHHDLADSTATGQ